MHAVPLECLVTWDRGAGRSERTVVCRRHAGGRGQPPETGRAGGGRSGAGCHRAVSSRGGPRAWFARFVNVSVGLQSLLPP